MSRCIWGAGWTLAGVLLAGVLIGIHGARTFVVESLRFRRTDLAWFARWPAAAFGGRFAYHGGHFDPGQRVLNVAMACGLVAVVASGAGMSLLHGGPIFALLSRVHTWSTYLVTPLVVGHWIVAAGILPGYRGVWRSMHLGGRLDPSVAGKLWPGWTEWHNRESLGAYVLDALEPGDRNEVERHLKACAECRAEVSSQRDTIRRLEGA